ncbi:MAG: RNA polymerase sigma factor [Myxococcota bacterium]|nr:RNA polymerase sigma factor [Myxococcota bacterium]
MGEKAREGRGGEPGQIRIAHRSRPPHSLDSLDDDALIARVASGDTDVLGTLYLRHEKMVRRAVYRFAPEIPEAQLEELVQDVFMLLCDKAAMYEASGKFKSYLYSIAVCKARTWRRNTWLRRRLLGAALNEEVSMTSRPPQAADSGLELRQVVSQALARLPEKQRVVLLLHAVEGFTGDEIAQILKISAQTVRTRLFRARQTLLENVNFSRWSEVLTQEAP